MDKLGYHLGKDMEAHGVGVHSTVGSEPCKHATGWDYLWKKIAIAMNFSGRPCFVEIALALRLLGGLGDVVGSCAPDACYGCATLY